jgi:DNA-directed RNA polymerase specialized sigma24 family protein
MRPQRDSIAADPLLPLPDDSTTDWPALSRTARSFARLWCFDREAAKDVAQDALVTLLSRKNGVRSVHAWLFVVTRRLARRRAASASPIIIPLHLASRGPACTRDRQYPLTLLHRVLREATLSIDERRLLIWISLGRTHAEIASYMRCSRRDVGQRVGRMRKRLDRALNYRDPPTPAVFRQRTEIVTSTVGAHSRPNESLTAQTTVNSRS